MKIEVTQGKLSKALNVVSKVAASSRSTLPILNNVLIRVDDNKVSLTATNLDMAIVDYLPVSSAENGVITVPARLLAEFVSNLPKSETVVLETKDNKIITKAGKYSSTINGAPADDFPELPEIDEGKVVSFKMGVDEFKVGANQVITASSNDLTRPALTGVFFNTNNNSLYIAATDGYRLAEKKIIEKVESGVAAIVPTASLSEVMRSINDEMDEIEILFDDTQVRFRIGEIEITSKLIDGSFPDYRQLIPKECESEVTLNRAELTRITRLAALFAKEVGGSITCEASVEKNAFIIKSVANEYGENDSELEAAVTKDEKVTLNSRFLIDVLNVVDEDEVRFGFSGKVSPVVIRNEKNQNYTHIIMPLKV